MTPATHPRQQSPQQPLQPPPGQQLMLEDVAGYVRAHIAQWIVEDNSTRSAAGEMELRERLIRVEEELRYQRELMKQGFEAMEKRFEAMEKRFEAIDKRFESMDKRFESMDKRFEAVSAESNRRFDAMSAENNRRFEEINQRLDRFMRWSFGITIGSASLVIAVLKFL